jgi:hypothetical protein
MSTLQERLAAITDTTANLKAQFRELDRLREHVRKAELRIAALGPLPSGAERLEPEVA